MEQNKIVLEGPKYLKWKTCKIKSIQDDEIIVMDPMLQIHILFIQEKLDMKVTVK